MNTRCGNQITSVQAFEDLHATGSDPAYVNLSAANSIVLVHDPDLGDIANGLSKQRTGGDYIAPPFCLTDSASNMCRTCHSGPKTDAWILAAVEELLRATGVDFAQLDCIATGCGPGTFTGIRVALAAGLGLAAGSGVQVCGIGSLDALAEGAQAATGRAGPLDVLALIDARRQQHYALRAVVDPTPVQIVPSSGPEAIGTEDLIARLEQDPPVVSVGATLALPSTVQPVEGPPLAVSIARLAARMSPDARPAAVPSYLRPPDAVPGISPLRRRLL